MSSGGPPYPVLKNHLILQIMAELEISLTESELTDPGRCRERVREVFCQLLCTCWGINRTQLTTLGTRSQSALTTPGTSISAFPKLYSDALVETKFFCMMQRLLKICGYDDFGLRDLAAPHGRRFKRQLSALINYLKYREDNKGMLVAVLEERGDMFEALEELAEQNEALQNQLNEVTKVNQTMMKEKEDADAECQEMEAEIAEQNKIQSSIRQQNQLLQKSANELKDQIANLSIALRELQAEERQLNKEVVHSPDSVKKDVHKAQKELENVQKLIVKTEEERNNLIKRLKNVVKGEERVKSAVELLENVDEKAQEYEIAAEDADDLSSKVDKAENSLGKKRREKEEKEIENRAIEQQHLHNKKKMTKQLDDVKNQTTSAMNKIGVAEKERLEDIARMEVCQKRVEELQACIQSEMKQADDDIRKRVEAYHKFEKSILSKHQEINASMGLLSH